MLTVTALLISVTEAVAGHLWLMSYSGPRSLAAVAAAEVSEETEVDFPEALAAVSAAEVSVAAVPAAAGDSATGVWALYDFG